MKKALELRWAQKKLDADQRQQQELLADEERKRVASAWVEGSTTFKRLYKEAQPLDRSLHAQLEVLMSRVQQKDVPRVLVVSHHPWRYMFYCELMKMIGCTVTGVRDIRQAATLASPPYRPVSDLMQGGSSSMSSVVFDCVLVETPPPEWCYSLGDFVYVVRQRDTKTMLSTKCICKNIIIAVTSVEEKRLGIQSAADGVLTRPLYRHLGLLRRVLLPSYVNSQLRLRMYRSVSHYDQIEKLLKPSPLVEKMILVVDSNGATTTMKPSELCSEIDHLRSIIDVGKKSRAKLEDEHKQHLAVLMDKEEQLRSSVHGLSEQLKKKEDDVTNLVGLVQHFRQEIIHLKSSIDGQDKKIRRVNSNQRMLQKENQNLKSELTAVMTSGAGATSSPKGNAATARSESAVSSTVDEDDFVFPVGGANGGKLDSILSSIVHRQSYDKTMRDHLLLVATETSEKNSSQEQAFEEERLAMRRNLALVNSKEVECKLIDPDAVDASSMLSLAAAAAAASRKTGKGGKSAAAPLASISAIASAINSARPTTRSSTDTSRAVTPDITVGVSSGRGDAASDVARLMEENKALRTKLHQLATSANGSSSGGTDLLQGVAAGLNTSSGSMAGVNAAISQKQLTDELEFHKSKAKALSSRVSELEFQLAQSKKMMSDALAKSAECSDALAQAQQTIASLKASAATSGPTTPPSSTATQVLPLPLSMPPMSPPSASFETGMTSTALSSAAGNGSPAVSSLAQSPKLAPAIPANSEGDIAQLVMDLAGPTPAVASPQAGGLPDAAIAVHHQDVVSPIAASSKHHAAGAVSRTAIAAPHESKAPQLSPRGAAAHATPPSDSTSPPPTANSQGQHAAVSHAASPPHPKKSAPVAVKKAVTSSNKQSHDTSAATPAQSAAAITKLEGQLRALSEKDQMQQHRIQQLDEQVTRLELDCFMSKKSFTRCMIMRCLFKSAFQQTKREQAELQTELHDAQGHVRMYETAAEATHRSAETMTDPDPFSSSLFTPMEFQAKVDDLTGKVAEANSQSKEAREELLTMQRRAAEKAKDYEQAHKTVGIMIEDAIRLKKTISSLEESLAAARAAYATQCDDSAKLLDDIESLQKQLQEKDVQKLELEEKLAFRQATRSFACNTIVSGDLRRAGFVNAVQNAEVQTVQIVGSLNSLQSNSSPLLRRGSSFASPGPLAETAVSEPSSSPTLQRKPSMSSFSLGSPMTLVASLDQSQLGSSDSPPVSPRAELAQREYARSMVIASSASAEDVSLLKDELERVLRDNMDLNRKYQERKLANRKDVQELRLLLQKNKDIHAEQSKKVAQVEKQRDELKHELKSLQQSEQTLREANVELSSRLEENGIVVTNACAEVAEFAAKTLQHPVFDRNDNSVVFLCGSITHVLNVTRRVFSLTEVTKQLPMLHDDTSQTDPVTFATGRGNSLTSQLLSSEDRSLLIREGFGFCETVLGEATTIKKSRSKREIRFMDERPEMDDKACGRDDPVMMCDASTEAPSAGATVLFEGSALSMPRPAPSTPLSRRRATYDGGVLGGGGQPAGDELRPPRTPLSSQRAHRSAAPPLAPPPPPLSLVHVSAGQAIHTSVADPQLDAVPSGTMSSIPDSSLTPAIDPPALHRDSSTPLRGTSRGGGGVARPSSNPCATIDIPTVGDTSRYHRASYAASMFESGDYESLTPREFAAALSPSAARSGRGGSAVADANVQTEEMPIDDHDMRRFVSALVERRRSSVVSFAAVASSDRQDEDGEIGDGNIETTGSLSRSSSMGSGSPLGVAVTSGRSMSIHRSPSVRRSSSSEDHSNQPDKRDTMQETLPAAAESSQRRGSIKQHHHVTASVDTSASSSRRGSNAFGTLLATPAFSSHDAQTDTCDVSVDELLDSMLHLATIHATRQYASSYMQTDGDQEDPDKYKACEMQSDGDWVHAALLHKLGECELAEAGLLPPPLGAHHGDANHRRGGAGDGYHHQTDETSLVPRFVYPTPKLRAAVKNALHVQADISVQTEPILIIEEQGAPDDADGGMGDRTTSGAAVIRASFYDHALVQTDVSFAAVSGTAAAALSRMPPVSSSCASHAPRTNNSLLSPGAPRSLGKKPQPGVLLPPLPQAGTYLSPPLHRAKEGDDDTLGAESSLLMIEWMQKALTAGGRVGGAVGIGNPSVDCSVQTDTDAAPSKLVDAAAAAHLALHALFSKLRSFFPSQTHSGTAEASSAALPGAASIVNVKSAIEALNADRKQSKTLTESLTASMRLLHNHGVRGAEMAIAMTEKLVSDHRAQLLQLDAEEEQVVIGGDVTHPHNNRLQQHPQHHHHHILMKGSTTSPLPPGGPSVMISSQAHPQDPPQLSSPQQPLGALKRTPAKMSPPPTPQHVKPVLPRPSATSTPEGIGVLLGSACSLSS